MRATLREENETEELSGGNMGVGMGREGREGDGVGRTETEELSTGGSGGNIGVVMGR